MPEINKNSVTEHKPLQQFLDDLPGCLAIIKGDAEDKREELHKLLTSEKRKPGLSEEFYLNVTQDCDAYIDNRGFITMPLSEEERDFPIAYSMVIHEKIEMFERLLRSIYNPQNVYCVHVDQKSPTNFKKAVQAIVSCFPNVFIATKLERVIYASWSRVQADVNCMENLLKSSIPWRYLLNTCGTDFPTKTNAEMVKALKLLNGRNSMESKTTNAYKKNRWLYHHNVTYTVIRTKIKKSAPPIRTPMFSGNAYIVITREFVRQLFENKEVQGLMEWEKNTYSPDEHMWATMQRMPSVPGSDPTNRSYDETNTHAIARSVKWSYLAGDVNNGAPYLPCTGAYRRAVCVYGTGDLRWLFQQHHLLANKFDPEVDNIAIRCIESVLRFKAINGGTNIL